MTTTVEAAPATVARPKKPSKPIETYVTTGWCRDGGQHNLCPGSGTNGSDAKGAHCFWFCQCECHLEQPTCRDCKRRVPEVTLTGTCMDPEDCEDYRASRRASNPQHAMLTGVLADAEIRRAEDATAKALAKAQARALDAERAPREGTGEGSPSPAPGTPARKRTAAAPPSPQRCHEGCGEMTKGGKFIAGHDARLKGRLVKAARQTKPETGSPATRTEAVKAMAELIARDWPRKNVDAKITAEADAIVEKYGHDKCIDAAVAARYRDQAAAS